MKDHIIIGVDVAADFSYFCILDPNGSVIKKSFKVDHNSDSIKYVVSQIKKAEEQYSINAVVYLESTGIYHLPHFYSLNDFGIKVIIINPLITYSIKNLGIRKVKNDKFDAYKIALLAYQSDFKPSVIPEPFIQDIKFLCHTYFSLKDDRTAHVNQLTAHIKMLFPAFCNVFSDITSKAAISILKYYTTPSDILNADSNEIIELIAKTSRRSILWATKKYNLLISAANDATCFSCNLNHSFSLINLQITIIETFDTQISNIEDKLKTIISENENHTFVEQISLLQTIPSVGFMSAITIMCEIGDFSVFNSPKQLFAYFGIDPSVNESGNFKGTRNHMSKRGSKFARRVLFTVALANIRRKKDGQYVNPILHEYYELKTKSKPKKVALGAIMHKIVNIIFAVLRDSKAFILKTPQQHCNECFKNSLAA